MWRDRLNARRVIFDSAQTCHPERKRGTSPMTLDHTNHIELPTGVVGSLVVFATRDHVL
jgi:hypothetical protein